MSGNLLWIPIAVYGVAWLAIFSSRWSPPERDSSAVKVALAIGWGVHTFILAASVYGSGLNITALLSAAAWIGVVAHYGTTHSGRLRPFGFVLLPLSVALLLSAILTSEEGLSRASYPGAEWIWRGLLVAHIVALLAGHLLFAIAFLGSIAYLLQERQIKTKRQPLGLRLPPLGTLETVTHRGVGLGFLFLTVGILLGLAVAGPAKWSHRLSELRLLIPLTSWVVYAGFLVVYDFRGRRGRFGAIWSIAGFLVVLISLVFELGVLASESH
jgi:ABC-type transport system involved in cytochrome c biogenesis permease subunit